MKNRNGEWGDHVTLQAAADSVWLMFPCATLYIFCIFLYLKFMFNIIVSKNIFHLNDFISDCHTVYLQKLMIWVVFRNIARSSPSLCMIFWNRKFLVVSPFFWESRRDKDPQLVPWMNTTIRTCKGDVLKLAWKLAAPGFVLLVCCPGICMPACWLVPLLVDIFHFKRSQRISIMTHWSRRIGF